MTALQVAARPLAPAAGLSMRGDSAVFLHAGWRSGGTWLWDTLRADARVRAYYEPLHEDLAWLDRAAIGAFNARAWGGGHGAASPYFAEFAPLLRPGDRGVAGYQRRFAFDNFFTGPDQSDPALEHYIATLLRHARDEGRMPVLKFARSAGRVAWLERRFPQASHAVILRDPRAQWRSARVQLQRDGNRYFMVVPFLIMARNPHSDLLAEAMAYLGVRAPPGLGGGLPRARDASWYHVRGLNWAERYRGFLAFWAASTVAALAGEATVIDADRIGTDATYRVAVEATLGSASLLEPLEQASRLGPAQGPIEDVPDADRAAASALAFVAAQRHRLTAERARLLETKLAEAAGNAPRAPSGQGVQRAGAATIAAAAGYVAMTRLLYPLRRAHYHLDRWIKRA